MATKARNNLTKSIIGSPCLQDSGDLRIDYACQDEVSKGDRRRLAHDLKMQRLLALFACTFLGLSCLTALALFCFQEFHAWGFRLDVSLMHWIGGVTVGVVATLASTVFKSFFGASYRISRKS
jgi:hypothetical protein